MSLTLVWDGQTHLFESRAHPRGSVHHNALVVKRLQKHIHLLLIGILGAEPSGSAILKIAREADEISALEQEAVIYANQLKSIQGKYVPEFYGIYHGEVMGSPVACMLLEYCTPGARISPDERNRKIMLAACAVHAAGLMHCELLSGHNLVMSGKDIKIVDFSGAVPHRCYGATPTLHPGRGGDSSQGCRELVALERVYGVFSGAAFPAASPGFVNPFAEENVLYVLARRVVGMVMPQ
ncbi:hypothetical protein B0H17DRAFT_1143517 [Mycena rosella]|uniref:Protein kinase domain-containing protein n=1 Tax=Mycena rosella TaxID=1033263 RepID=A0AAD7CW65_MYCRO|nr:hypothetical protein B0H17DRAFT_1143517 [Mycena rosella]